MTTSAKGKDFIKQFEGFRNTMYLDAGGLPTIGYGHLIKPGEEFYNNTTISKAQGDMLFTDDLKQFEAAVNTSVVKQLNQNQFDALVSLAYNIGAGAFADSTVVKRINTNATVTDITTNWQRWNKVNGVLNAGLLNRRNAEIEVYFSGYEPSETRKKKSGFSLV
jgi:lysozyme